MRRPRYRYRTWTGSPRLQRILRAPSQEKRRWDAFDRSRANSGLKSQEYSGPIICLIFLRLAEVRFTAQRVKLMEIGAFPRLGGCVDDTTGDQARSILYSHPVRASTTCDWNDPVISGGR